MGGVREDRPHRSAVTGPAEPAETNFRNFRKRCWYCGLGCTPWVRQQNCGQFPEQSLCRGFPPVSAGFRRVAPSSKRPLFPKDRRFPPFPPFPPLVLLSHPKDALPLNRRHGACSRQRHRAAPQCRRRRNRGRWRSNCRWAGGDIEEACQHLVGGAQQAIAMGEFVVFGFVLCRLSGSGHLSILRA